jgi:hypothetical protein
MRLIRTAYICSAMMTAVCALVAAGYWYLSSRPTPSVTNPPAASIDDVPALYILGTQVDMYSVNQALAEVSHLNKCAAAWSAAAALCGAVTALLAIPG